MFKTDPFSMIKINNIDDLKSAAATLHDARFTEDAIEFNPTTGAMALKCWVLQAKPKGAGPSQRFRAFRLSFMNVFDCKMSTKEKVCYYELATIRFSKKDRKLDLVAHYGIEVTLLIGDLDATLTETSETRDTWE